MGKTPFLHGYNPEPKGTIRCPNPECKKVIEWDGVSGKLYAFLKKCPHCGGKIPDHLLPDDFS